MLYKRGAVWWVKYYRAGRAIRESAGTTKEKVARDLLKLREDDVARGVPLSPRVGRIRYEEAMADVVNDYKSNDQKSLRNVELRNKLHLQPFFGGRRMAAITPTDVRAYITKRQEEGAANASINRELALLKRAFVLACQSSKLVRAAPHPDAHREQRASRVL